MKIVAIDYPGFTRGGDIVLPDDLPFDDAICERCDTGIGALLGCDPETGHPTQVWVCCFRVDGGPPVCEDCTAVYAAAYAQLEVAGRDGMNPPAGWRTRSLSADYEMMRVPNHGTGLYPVRKTTGKVCDCKMEWFLDGTVLMCPVCYLDGT